RMGDALYGNVAKFLAHDLVSHQRVSLVRDQDLAGGGCTFEPRGQVHTAADDGVVHSVLAAEISYRAEAGVDADPAPQGIGDSGVAPSDLQLCHFLTHGDRHLDAGQRVLFDAAGLRVAEEDDDGIAHVLVDGGTVGSCD